ILMAYMANMASDFMAIYNPSHHGHHGHMDELYRIPSSENQLIDNPQNNIGHIRHYDEHISFAHT
ncbi:MAG: hypothetical protein EZS28_025903, partial [Streblomastix strix]